VTLFFSQCFECSFSRDGRHLLRELVKNALSDNPQQVTVIITGGER
jgi:hypothetical protein